MTSPVSDAWSTAHAPAYSTPAPIAVVHQVISGCRQHGGRANGSQLLWAELRDRHHNGRVLVDLREWHTPWDRHAELLWRQRPTDDTPVAVYIYAYSWGAGWGAIRLARELRKRGITVIAVVFADPVYRDPIAIRNWRALWPYSTVWVPANIQNVYWTRQFLDWPRAHNVRAEDPDATWINPPVVCDRTHAYMDEAPEFRRLVHLVADHAKGGHLPWVNDEGLVCEGPRREVATHALRVAETE
jgi:hypothetical protein